MLTLAAATSRAGAAIVAEWDFSEASGTAANSSVGGWTGTLVNFPDTSAGAGDAIGANGWTSDSRLSFGGSFTGNAPRVETTFPLNSLIGSSFTLEFVGSHNNPTQTWGELFGQSGGCCFFFGKTSGTTTMHANFNGLGTAYSGYVGVGDTALHHSAVVFDDAADTIQFYYDHRLVGTATGITGTLNDQGLLWLGSAAHQPSAEYWNGTVDTVRISNEVLAPAQMLAVPSGPTPPAGVAAWWRMEDSSGGIATDSSGNGFHAGLGNFANTSAGAGNTTNSGWADQLISPLTDQGAAIASSGSLHTDGTNDFVQTSLPVPTGSFTLEAIVSADNPAPGWSPIFGESLASGNTGIFFFGQASGGGNLHYNIDGLGSATITNVNVADGNPHHIALMYDENRDNVVVFFDSQPVYVRNGATGTPVPLAGSTIRLASRDDTHAGEKFAGQIDEARVWNVPALPAVMLGGNYQNAVAKLRIFSDHFESGNRGWYYMQNAGNDVGIIPEPGNPSNNVLQVVSATNGRATSAIMQQVDLVGRFDAQFRFRIPAGNGADGFTFGVFDVPYHLGGSGGGLGYYDPSLAGRFPSFAVEFDTYQGGTPGESNENHVSIQRNYDINDYVGTGPSDYVPSFDMEDGQWAYARVVLEDGLISVWLNQTGFTFGAGDLLIDGLDLGDVDLSGNGRFDPFTGYFGFTAGSGGLNDQVIIDDFTLQIVPEPSSLLLLVLGALGLSVVRWRRRRGAVSP